jgi:lipopolysaccharide biosynthesis protein
VSAHLIGLRDVVLEGNYDLVCRLHTKQSLQDPFAMARHFREHLFENLASSRPYLERLFTLFEADPSIGTVMPPAIHQGYPVLGRGWFENRPAARAWADRLGIDVPFDDSTPLAAYGSMYWYRPRALRVLFNHPFTWDDFPREGEYRDGSLAHVLERLVTYAAQASGHTVWCVQNTKHAEKSYVRLEFKLQDAIAEAKRLSLMQDEAPLPHVKALVRRGLRPAPTVLSSLTSGYRAVRAAYHFMRRLSSK